MSDLPSRLYFPSAGKTFASEARSKLLVSMRADVVPPPILMLVAFIARSPSVTFATFTSTAEPTREPSAEIFSGTLAGLLNESPKAIASALRSLDALNLTEPTGPSAECPPDCQIPSEEGAGRCVPGDGEDVDCEAQDAR